MVLGFMALGLDVSPFGLRSFGGRPCQQAQGRGVSKM